MAQADNTWRVQRLNDDGSNNGPAKTFAELGIDSASYELNNLAADTMTFTVGGRNLDAADLWPFGTLLAVLQPNGTRFFVGRVEPWTREGAPDAHNHFGRLVNPWWYLANKIYEQTFKFAKFANAPAVGQPQVLTGYDVYTTPRVILNILNDPNTGFRAVSTGEQIADAVNWAISLGAPIKLGDVDPATMPFSDAQKGIFCADVIKLMFRKEPDFVVDWDYATLPFPTIHFRKQKSFTPVTIDLRDVVRREQVSIKERPDWQRSYVRINYDQVNTNNGAQYLQPYVDLYPDPIPAGVEARFRGVDLFCDLTGYITNSSSQTASFASAPADINDLATWKKWKPALAAGTVANVVILQPGTIPPPDGNRPAPGVATLDELDANGAAVAYDPACAYEVVDGEWADWINGVKAQRCRVTAWAQITHKNGKVTYEQLTHDPTLVSTNTNGIVREFAYQPPANIQQFAEMPPANLAKSMWTSWKNLCIEGSFVNVAAVVGAGQPITRSTSLNFITNGGVDWSNVNAIVQSISGDIQKGAQKVSFGAPLKITGNDLIDAIRATRFRVTTIDVSYFFGGPMGGGAGTNLKLGRKTHARSTHSGGTHKQIDVVSKAIEPAAGVDPVIKSDGATGVSQWVPPNGPTVVPPGAQQPVSTPVATVDPAKCKGSDGNWHPVYFQEQKVCVKINGVLKQRTLIAWTSDIYQAPDDPA